MPVADVFEAPQGSTVHGRLLEAITEAFAGNGITSTGDAAVTADGDTPMGVDVAAATDLRYDGDSFDPSSESFTLSTGPTSTTNGEEDRRADLVWFDPTDGADGAFKVTEGTPDPNPEPPATPADGLMLAVVNVEHDVDDVIDDDIQSWRAIASVAWEVDSDDIGEDAVATVHIQEDAVTGDELAEDAVATVHVATNAITGDELAEDAVATVHIQEDAVGGEELDDGSVSDTHVTTDADISRTKLDRDLIVVAVSANTQTDGDDVYLVDTTGGAVTLTLASDDAESGRRIQVIDVGGDADVNPITIDTEGTETIDGEDDHEIDAEWGALVVVSDGTDWFTAGGGVGAEIDVRDDGNMVVEGAEELDFKRLLAVTEDGDTAEIDVDVVNIFEGREGGNVPNDESGIVAIDHLEDGDEVRVYKCGLTTASVEAIPEDVDLQLVTFDNAGNSTVQETLISGDGSTVHDRVTGDPVATFTATSDTSVGVIVDNTSGSAEDVFAYVEGVTVT